MDSAAQQSENDITRALVTFFPNVCCFDPVSPHNHASDIEMLSAGAADVATIRRATTDDAELLARLAERTFRDAFAAEHDPTDVDLHCATNFGTEIRRQACSELVFPRLLRSWKGMNKAWWKFCKLLLDHQRLP